jgi:hypothetical protein
LEQFPDDIREELEKAAKEWNVPATRLVYAILRRQLAALALRDEG